MKQLIKNNLIFFVPYFIFIIASVLLMVFYSKTNIHIAINSLHSRGFDTFFKLITCLGNGFIYLFMIIYLLTRKFKLAIAFIFAVVVSTIIIYFFKQVVFPETYRPVKYFEMYENYKLYIVKGVKLHIKNSFPSGHTTTAFAVFFTLSTIIKENILKLLCFIVALLVGYSRLYLSQHFLIDVVVGSLLGVSSVIAAFCFSKYFVKSKLKGALFYDKRKKETQNSSQKDLAY